MSPPHPLRPQSSTLYAAGAAILLCLLAWGTNPFPLLGIDDADITLVYARNIAAGAGYVYVPGGERVEGSTSLLWTLACAAVHALASDAFMRPAGFAIGIVLTVASVLCLVRLAEIVSPDDGAAWRLLLLWLAANPLFFLWNSATLMDLGLFTATLNLLVLCCCADHRSARYPGIGPGVAGSLLALTRPEGMAIAPFLCALAAAGHWAATGDRRGALAMLGRSIGILALVLGAVALGRTLYFGFPFPNTYYAKVSSHPLDNLLGGLRYGWRYVQAQPWMVAVVAAAGVAAIRAIHAVLAGTRTIPALDRPAQATLLCLSGAGILFALPLLTGDDHFEGFRFMQPAGALVAIPALGLLGGSRVPGRSLLLAGMIAICLAAGAMNWSRFVQERILAGDFRIAQDMKDIAGEFNDRIDPRNPPLFGVVMAGGFALAYQGPVFDMLGLNDVEMAHASGRRQGHPGHSAFDAGVFWRRHPDIVAPQRFDTAPAVLCDAIFRLDNRVFGGLYFTERFAREYALGYFPARAGVISAFFSRRWLDSGQGDWVTVADVPMTVDDPATCHRNYPG